MGIHDLSKVIADKAPEAVKENEMKNLFGESCLLLNVGNKNILTA